MSTKSREGQTASQIIESEVKHYNEKYSVKPRKPTWIWRIPELNVFGKYLRNLGDKKILEIGCGNSASINFLVSELNLGKINYLGTEISDEAVKNAQKENPQWKFEVADACNLPYKDESFDIVLCFGVLHHLPRPYDGLKECFRVLKKGGLILLREPSDKAFRRGETEFEEGLNVNELESEISNSGEIIAYKKTETFPVKLLVYILNKTPLGKLLGRSFWRLKTSVDFAIYDLTKKGVNLFMVLKKR